ncbi:MAG: glycosyltransferase [Acidimicrobiia bacterium]
MKVSMVSEHASPLALLGGVDAGGQNVHVAALARGLAALGAEVVVHTRRDDPALPRRVEFAPGVVVDHVDAGPPEPIPKDALAGWMDAFADDLVAQWATDRPDVVHAHFWMSGIAAVDAGDRARIPVALTYHALGAEKRRHQGQADTSPPGRVAVESWLARASDHVVATTAHEARAVAAMGALHDDVTVVPCGVDLDRFRTDGPRMHRPGRRRTQIACVSRLVPRKGIADVIRALVHLPDAELLVAGGPPQAMLHEDDEARALRRIAVDAGVEDRVRFLGAVERDDVPALLRSVDVVCCCPWYEPFGLVAVEAMACGVPVVASRVGGLAETVVDGRTGVLVPPRDPSAIASAIRHVTDDPRRHGAMAQAACARAHAYGWDRIAARTAAVYERLVADGRRHCTEPIPPWYEAPADELVGGKS